MTLPAITSDKLLPFKQICQRLLEDPEYLDRPFCTYPQHVKDWLKLKFKAQDVVAGTVGMVESVDLLDPRNWEDSAAKSRQLYTQLERLKLGTSDTGENIQILKAQAGLLERLIVIGDKSLGHKEMAKFRQTILDAVEDLMTPDQRTALIARLEVL